MIAENINHMDSIELSDDELRSVYGTSGGPGSAACGAGGVGNMMGGTGSMGNMGSTGGAGACNTVGIGSLCNAGMMGNIDLSPMQQAMAGCGAALSPAPINPANFTLCLNPTY